MKPKIKRVHLEWEQRTQLAALLAANLKMEGDKAVYLNGLSDELAAKQIPDVRGVVCNASYAKSERKRFEKRNAPPKPEPASEPWTLETLAAAHEALRIEHNKLRDFVTKINEALPPSQKQGKLTLVQK